MSGMIRILSVDNPKADGVSWWRNLMPLTEIQRKWKDISVNFVGENASLSDILACDLVVMYRPITSKSLSFINTCKAMGKKIILDIDDNLWRLPPGHPSEADYQEHEHILRQIYHSADGIWCSTDPLMDFTDARGGRGRVVPNAVLPSDLPDAPSVYRGIVCWRGSQSQHADIENEQSKALFEENRQRFSKWFFWGYYPASMRAENTHAKRRVDLVEYFYGLKNTGINLMWKPLQVNEFNNAKSNIAWVEATMAGAVCVTNYATKPGWEWAIDRFSDNADFIATQWQASRDAIIEHYNLDKVNAIRYHHILQVLGIEGEDIDSDAQRLRFEKHSDTPIFDQIDAFKAKMIEKRISEICDEAPTDGDVTLSIVYTENNGMTQAHDLYYKGELVGKFNLNHEGVSFITISPVKK